jgi:redox-sensitive bicupin YhaK (pirin superfamily)
MSGELAHKDNMGNVKGIPPGDVQRMSAGSGVMHSEFNHAPQQQTHFLQIWIEPAVKGIPPSYEEKHFEPESKSGKLRLIASPDGDQGSVTIHQDARLYASILQANQEITHSLADGRTAYLHLIRGTGTANNTVLHAGDALKYSSETSIVINQAEDAELLLFDLPY